MTRPIEYPSMLRPVVRPGNRSGESPKVLDDDTFQVEEEKQISKAFFMTNSNQSRDRPVLFIILIEPDLELKACICCFCCVHLAWGRGWSNTGFCESEYDTDWYHNVSNLVPSASSLLNKGEKKRWERG